MAIVVIGVSEAGIAGLQGNVSDRVFAADLVIAAPRFHGQIPDGPEIVAWPSPFSDIYELLDARQGENIVVLATGDPLWFGAGASLIARIGVDNCEIIKCESECVHGPGKICLCMG